MKASRYPSATAHTRHVAGRPRWTCCNAAVLPALPAPRSTHRAGAHLAMAVPCELLPSPARRCLVFRRQRATAVTRARTAAAHGRRSQLTAAPLNVIPVVTVIPALSGITLQLPTALRRPRMWPRQARRRPRRVSTTAGCSVCGSMRRRWRAPRPPLRLPAAGWARRRPRPL